MVPGSRVRHAGLGEKGICAPKIPPTGYRAWLNDTGNFLVALQTAETACAFHATHYSNTVLCAIPIVMGIIGKPVS